MAEKDAFMFCPELGWPELAATAILDLCYAGSAAPVRVLRCWNFSRIDDNLLWY